MQRKAWRYGLVPALWVALAAGCEKGGGRQIYPPDPLLASRKPVEARQEKTEPILVARSEPASPDPPPSAIASSPVDLQLPGKSRLAQKPISATTVGRPSDSAPVPATPAMRRRSGDQ